MKFSTFINGALALALAAVPVSATSAALFAEVDLAVSFVKDKYGGSADVCTPPKVVTCGSSNTYKRDEVPDLADLVLREDANVEDPVADVAKRFFFNKYPKASCSVSSVKKIKDELFEVVINFELSKWEYLYSILSGSVKWLAFKGTQCNDDYWVIIDDTKSKCLVSKWTQWSAVIVVKPQKAYGKCCLPDGLSLELKFKKYGGLFSLFTSYFSKDLTWTFSKPDGKFVEFDAYASFFASLSARDQAEVMAAPMKPHMQKRFLDFSFATSVFASLCTSGTTFKNFCWDCDC